MQKAVIKTTLLLVFTFLVSLPALSQYRHPGEDLPERATMLSLSSKGSWIVFFCPTEESCEAHVVCYYKGEPVALDPVIIEPKSGTRLNLYEALRDVGFSEAASSSRKDCQVRSAQDLDIRAYTRIGGALVKASEKTIAVKIRTPVGPPEFVTELPELPDDFIADLHSQFMYGGYHTIWTTVHNDPRDECGGRGDNDVGIVFLEDGALSGAHNELRLWGFVSDDGKLGGVYVDAISFEQNGLFEGQAASKTTASGTWNSKAWGCTGTWEMDYEF